MGIPLDEFFLYKNQLMEDMLTDEEIVKLINEDIPVERAYELMYTQVFPCEYVPKTIQDGKTYICCDVDIQKALSKTYLSPTVFIWVFTHRSQLFLPDGGGVRPDKICSKICEKINGSMEYGLGQLDLYSVKRFAPMTDYQGKLMTFYATDFNRFYEPNKRVPTNRKEI